MIHVAILHRRYLSLVLDGAKTVEARLLRVRCAPFGRVSAGERVYLKRSGGPYAAAARARRVDHLEGLTPRAVRQLRDRWNHLVRGDDQFWRAAADARYATLVWLDRVRPVTTGPRTPASNRRGWICLPDEEPPA
jgi:hypothetical protein